MPSQYISLPPGVYNIQTGGKNVVNPVSNNKQLTIASANKNLNQQWLITGEGIVKSMQDDVTWAYSDLDEPGTPLQITRQDNKSVPWIIKVIPSPTDSVSFTGSIMTSDITQRFWGLDGNQVQLDETLSINWKFIPA